MPRRPSQARLPPRTRADTLALVAKLLPGSAPQSPTEAKTKASKLAAADSTPQDAATPVALAALPPGFDMARRVLEDFGAASLASVGSNGKKPAAIPPAPPPPPIPRPRIEVLQERAEACSPGDPAGFLRAALAVAEEAYRLAVKDAQESATGLSAVVEGFPDGVPPGTTEVVEGFVKAARAAARAFDRVAVKAREVEHWRATLERVSAS